MLDHVVLPISFIDSVLVFAVYSFAGWIVEVVYRSWTQKRFVNAGFLVGPFVPLYGMGSLLVLGIGTLLKEYNPFFFIIAVGLVLTTLEYFIGYLSEKFLGLKLWDYSSNRFNLHGRVCLSFSVAWAVLAYALAVFVHPKVSAAINLLNHNLAVNMAIAFLAYYSIDLILSTVSALGFKKKIADILAAFSTKSDAELQAVLASFKRLMKSFPNLNTYLDGSVKANIRMRLGDLANEISAQAVDELKKRRPADKEYISIVKDILMNSEFQRLKGFFHHNSSIYEHARRVSYLSYRICKILDLDYRAAARGGLLHDFFLYDWRNHSEPELSAEKFHGLHHPKIALANSMRNFELSDKEKDIIVKHMWPLTFTPPRYKESYVVTFVDKYLSSAEFLQEFAKKASLSVKGKRKFKKTTDAVSPIADPDTG